MPNRQVSAKAQKWMDIHSAQQWWNKSLRLASGVNPCKASVCKTNNQWHCSCSFHLSTRYVDMVDDEHKQIKKKNAFFKFEKNYGLLLDIHVLIQCTCINWSGLCLHGSFTSSVSHSCLSYKFKELVFFRYANKNLEQKN